MNTSWGVKGVPLQDIDAGAHLDLNAAAWLYSAMHAQRVMPKRHYLKINPDADWLTRAVPHEQLVNLTRENAALELISSRPLPIDPALVTSYTRSVEETIKFLHLKLPECYQGTISKKRYDKIAHHLTNHECNTLAKAIKRYTADDTLRTLASVLNANRCLARIRKGHNQITYALRLTEVGTTQRKSILTPQDIRQFVRFKRPVYFLNLRHLYATQLRRAAVQPPPKNSKWMTQQALIKAVSCASSKFRAGSRWVSVKDAGFNQDILAEDCWMRVARAIEAKNPENLRWTGAYLEELGMLGRLMFPGEDGVEERVWACLVDACGNDVARRALSGGNLARQRTLLTLLACHRGVGHDGREINGADRRTAGLWSVIGSADSLIRLEAFRQEMTGNLVLGLNNGVLALAFDPGDTGGDVRKGTRWPR